MAKILVLDDLTANQIAAGEVIERPASVVKELVENSLDAGAENIEVEIKEGGLGLIRIKDDGCGMSEEDALLAIKRHATSKLRLIHDLESLTSLGFRGEALPSIVSVARVEIITRESSGEHGTRLVVEGNSIKTVEPAGAPRGTAIIVRDLFFNTPARRKFLRSEGYEGGLIHELMNQFALSHPAVSFRLLLQGKEVLNTAGINKLEDLLQLFHGSGIKDSLVSIEGPVSQGQVQGYLTLPTYQRVNRKGTHFFVNGRKVLSRELLNAVEDAYENSLPRGRFPLAVLHINLPPHLLDVNVHPNKLEIKIRDQHFQSQLRVMVQETLCRKKIIPHYILEQSVSGTDLILEPQTGRNYSPSKPLAAQEVWREFFSWGRESGDGSLLETAPINMPGKEPVSLSQSEEAFSPSFSSTPGHDKPSEPEPQAIQTSLPRLQVIGQMSATFILAEGEEGLYIIDQHVAHERILFEELEKKAALGPLSAQALLIPLTLELSNLEEEILLEHILPLTELGIVLEHFGPRCYLIRAVPAGVEGDAKDFVLSLLHSLENQAKNITPADVRREFLITASCKGAVKARQKLSWQEMDRLIRDLGTTINPLTCPHGRPVIYKITHHQLLRAFRRV